MTSETLGSQKQVAQYFAIVEKKPADWILYFSILLFRNEEIKPLSNVGKLGECVACRSFFKDWLEKVLQTERKW